MDGLYNEISAILGLDKQYKMVVVGAGNLGQAIANHTYYYKSGFIVSAIFEMNPRLIGRRSMILKSWTMKGSSSM